jgi:hypothetical protein
MRLSFPSGRPRGAGGADHQLLQRQRFQAQVQGDGPSAVGLVQRAGYDRRRLRGDPPAVPDRTPGGELRDGDGRAADAGGGAAQVVGGHVERDPAPVDDHHPLHQAGGLVDQVSRQQHGPGMFGVVGEQPVVEQLPGQRVQPRVRFVEQRHLGPGGQSDHDAQRRAHSPGELPDLPVQRQAEFLEQRAGQLVAPVRVEPGRGLHRLPDLQVRVALVLADEHHPAQHRLVLDRGGAEHGHGAGRGELMARDDAQERGLTRAVAAEQPADRPGFEVEGDVVQGELVAVAAGQPGHRDRRCHSVVPPFA